jgi:adenine phosphoribosyltransferase
MGQKYSFFRKNSTQKLLLNHKNSIQTKKITKEFSVKHLFCIIKIVFLCKIFKKRHIMFDISKIRTVKDFPKPGINFFDITTVLNDADSFQELFQALLEKARDQKPDVIAALEARGYIFASALALALNIPFVTIKKKGKLPYKTFSEQYDLEYGHETIEFHQDAMNPHQRVLICDDILATGGTAAAAAKLMQHFNPETIEFLFLMELSFLNGREKIAEYETESLIVV